MIALTPYRPIFLIIGFCLLGAWALSAPIIYTPHLFMAHFMGLFFFIFALFKFFDLDGFVNGFAKYDFMTQRFRMYGYAYPVLELLLAILYLSRSILPLTNVLTIVLMVVSGIGVTRAIMRGEDLRCACLGTMLNVKLSTLSAVENWGMALMAAAMLLT